MAFKNASRKSAVRGTKTKRIRKALRLTQAEWAARLGVTVVTVSRWENGHRDPAEHMHASIQEAAVETGIDL